MGFFWELCENEQRVYAMHLKQFPIVYLSLRQRDHSEWGRDRERERERERGSRERIEVGSALTAATPARGLNSQTMRS